MRFSTLATAVVFGAVVNAAVVYETAVVTITSCGPEVVNCPGKTHPSTLAVVEHPVETPVAVVPVVPTSVAVVAPVETPVAVEKPAPEEPVVEETPKAPVVEETPEALTPAELEEAHPVKPAHTAVLPPYPIVGTGGVAAPTGYPILPSGTGSSPSFAVNTSTPIVNTNKPSSGDVFEGAASIKTFSLFAAFAAAGAVFLA